ncbi:MAG: DUF429 domain-containing protein [Candidatus Bathyarchaeia archaeon]
MKNEVIIGIDLAAKPENSTGWALWKNKIVKTALIHTDSEIIEKIVENNPTIVAIDAPFSLPKKGMLRNADKEMIRLGYRVFPPKLPSMKQLTLRCIRLNKLIRGKGYETIEVHPTSTCKALSMPIKKWEEIQDILKKMGLKGDVRTRVLSPHEIDAVISALTAHLYLIGQTESVGNDKEGYITVPKKQDWRTFKVI